MSKTLKSLSLFPHISRQDFATSGPGSSLYIGVIPDAEGERKNFIEQHKSWLPDPLLSATASRQAEFITGRHCSAAALHDFGFEQHLVGYNPDRSPLWPPGIRGAISHKHQIAIAMASDCADFVGLDIEAELAESRVERIKSKIIDAQEEAIIRTSGTEFNSGFTQVFSAKETLYKAIYPYLGRYLGFNTSKLKQISEQSLTLELREDLARELPHSNIFSINIIKLQDFWTTVLVSQRNN